MKRMLPTDTPDKYVNQNLNTRPVSDRALEIIYREIMDGPLHPLAPTQQKADNILKFPGFDLAEEKR